MEVLSIKGNLIPGASGTAEGVAFDNAGTDYTAGNVDGALRQTDQRLKNAVPTVPVVSDAWVSTKTYAVGDYAIYNNNIWKCLIQHRNVTPVAGPYWQMVSVAGEIGALKSNLTGLIVIESKQETQVSVSANTAYQRSVSFSKEGYTCYFLYASLYASGMGSKFYFKTKRALAGNADYDIMNMADKVLNANETTYWLCIKNT